MLEVPRSPVFETVPDHEQQERQQITMQGLKHLLKTFTRRTRPPTADRPGLPPLTTPERIAMTVGCPDCATIPKVEHAGEIISLEDTPVQIMHNGIRVRADGYCGEWMTAIIKGLKGHHEPQEEAVFHAILPHCRAGHWMVELGAWWAYYTNWYLRDVPDSRAICIEPDAVHRELTQANLRLNHQTADVVAGCVGSKEGTVELLAETEQRSIAVPCFNAAAIDRLTNQQPIEILHLDVQGAETDFLRSLHDFPDRTRLRFLFVSTHHALISGSPTTHADCLSLLRELGAVILTEHSIGESFSGDGLIVASFQKTDAEIPLPAISRNVPERSLFRTA